MERDEAVAPAESELGGALDRWWTAAPFEEWDWRIWRHERMFAITPDGIPP
jgi:hypothetical protein